MKKIIMPFSLGVLIAGIAISVAVKSSKSYAAPTAQSIMAAEEGLAKAFRENNADAIQSYLADDWAVVTAKGDVAEGNSIFPSGIRSGYRALTAFDMSEPRVRVFGDRGLVTFKLHLAGMFAGKPFDVMERETDVWAWKNGDWKCVLSHETFFPKKDREIGIKL